MARSWTGWKRSATHNIGSDLPRRSFASLPQPILAKGSQPRQRLAVLLPVRGGFARDDVIDVANRETLNVHPSVPCIGEAFDAVRRENQVQVEGTILELDEIFAAGHLLR